MLLAGGLLVILGLVAIILSFVIAGWATMLWVGVAVIVVGVVLAAVAWSARRRGTPL